MPMNPKEIVENYEKSNVVKPENRNNEKHGLWVNIDLISKDFISYDYALMDL